MGFSTTFAENHKIEASLVPAEQNATVQGTGFSVKDYNSISQIFSIGVPGITLSPTDKIEVFLEHSDDNVTYTRTTEHTGQVEGGADGLYGAYESNAAASSNAKTGYYGNKEWVRTDVVFSGTHGTATPCAVTTVLGEPKLAPVE